MTVNGLEPELRLLDPRDNARENQYRSHDDSPQLNVKHILIKAGLGGSTNCRQRKGQDDISTDSVVFI